MTKFKCNGCKRDTEFLWLDQTDMPEGFKLYQCMDCGCVGVKNIAEQKMHLRIARLVDVTAVGLGSLKTCLATHA